MKKLFLIIIALFSTGIVYLAVAGSEIQEIKTDIEISATPEKVWRILSDINSWEKWSPIIKGANGTASVGNELTIKMIGKNEGEEGPVYNPVITEIRAPNYLRWQAHMVAGFIFTNYKILELEETSSGTRLTHRGL